MACVRGGGGGEGEGKKNGGLDGKQRKTRRAGEDRKHDREIERRERRAKEGRRVGEKRSPKPTAAIADV